MCYEKMTNRNSFISSKFVHKSCLRNTEQECCTGCHCIFIKRIIMPYQKNNVLIHPLSEFKLIVSWIVYLWSRFRPRWRASCLGLDEQQPSVFATRGLPDALICSPPDRQKSFDMAAKATLQDDWASWTVSSWKRTHITSFRYELQSSLSTWSLAQR